MVTLIFRNGTLIVCTEYSLRRVEPTPGKRRYTILPVSQSRKLCSLSFRAVSGTRRKRHSDSYIKHSSLSARIAVRTLYSYAYAARYPQLYFQDPRSHKFMQCSVTYDSTFTSFNTYICAQVGVCKCIIHVSWTRDMPVEWDTTSGGALKVLPIHNARPSVLKCSKN